MDEEFQAVEDTDEVDVKAFEVRLGGFGVEVEVGEDAFAVPGACVDGEEVDAPARVLGVVPVEGCAEHGSAVSPGRHVRAEEEAAGRIESGGNGGEGVMVDVGEEHAPG